MKTFFKILAGILALIIIIAVALNLYFTDERLKLTVMPYVDDAVGRPVHVGSMSLTFFSTFPQPGISIEDMSIPGETEQDTLMSLKELVVGVNLFSLFGDEIQVSEIKLNSPHFIYKVNKDSTSNIDFLLSSEAEDTTTSEATAINIPYFEINNATLGYEDATSSTSLRLQDLDASIALRYADLIESTVDLNLGGLYATVDSTNYVSGLPLSLSEESTINLKDEVIQLRKGTFSIKGLALDLSGNIRDWSKTPAVDLAFHSSSDNFGELLRLVPKKYEESIRDFQTSGALAIDGTVKGEVGGDATPAFDVSMQVENGYLRNPDLPQAIEDIQLSAKATNKLVSLQTLTAKAGPNTITAKGSLEQPLKDDGTFTLDMDGNVDLATIQSFYDMKDLGIESMSGLLKVKANAKGKRDKPEDAVFDAAIQLNDGSLKYADVPEAIRQITVNANANQDLLTIKGMSLKAAQNTFSMNGTVNKPLDDSQRRINVDTKLRFDLASIKNFYPISEDTLKMSGLLTAQATLRGKADHIERAVESGSINLKDGLVDYKKIGKPFRDITLESVLDGNQLTVVNASFKTGDNSMKATGIITDYLSDDRKINMKLDGHADLKEIADYYQLEPNINKLTGTADMNLKAEGPVNDPAKMAFNGKLTIQNMDMEGDSLPQPVHELNGELVLTPTAATLKKLTFNLGSSDIDLSGSLQHYMEYLKTEKSRKTTPQLTGNFKSSYLNVDELIDWEDTTETNEKILIDLPDLNSSVTASINKLLITGVNMHNMQANASTTPKQIKLDKASIELFEGKASGSFVWNVPRPDRTKIDFQGSLDSLRAESFFKEYHILGKKSDFHKYISGSFSSKVQYSSELDAYLSPVIQTTLMDGTFGMTKARLHGHPVQEKIADFLKAKEFKNIVLDEWKSTFSVKNSVLTLKNLKLTSGDIGMELDGTQHLTSGAIDYDAKIFLPGRFKKGIASVITKQAADALTQENGTIMVPLAIKGTQDNPKIAPNQDVIKPIIEKYLKDKAGNVLKKLFGGGDG